jgi:hypothetical protein
MRKLQLLNCLLTNSTFKCSVQGTKLGPQAELSPSSMGRDNSRRPQGFSVGLFASCNSLRSTDGSKPWQFSRLFVRFVSFMTVAITLIVAFQVGINFLWRCIQGHTRSCGWSEREHLPSARLLFLEQFDLLQLYHVTYFLIRNTNKLLVNDAENALQIFLWTAAARKTINDAMTAYFVPYKRYKNQFPVTSSNCTDCSKHRKKSIKPII